jgi:hypothetical protein
MCFVGLGTKYLPLQLPHQLQLRARRKGPFSVWGTYPRTTSSHSYTILLELTHNTLDTFVQVRGAQYS